MPQHCKAGNAAARKCCECQKFSTYPAVGDKYASVWWTRWRGANEPGILREPAMKGTMGSIDGTPHPIADGATRAMAAKPRLEGTVLLVEDDADIRSMTATILRIAGATVFDTSSATEAIRWLDDHAFDAVVLDWNLAGEKGSVLLEKLRDEHPGLLRRSAVVTGDVMSRPGRHEAERYGCPVLAKPFRPRQLVETVSEILHRVD